MSLGSRRLHSVNPENIRCWHRRPMMSSRNSLASSQATNYQLPINKPYGRGGGVGRGLGVGPCLGVGVGLGVAVAVAVPLPLL